MMEFDRSKLAEQAMAARQNAYAPYSGFTVGAALLAQDGRVFTGCNVENAAYGLANCAERTALFKAVSEGARRFTAIAIAGGPTQNQAGPLPNCAPCGSCRQALYEFGGANLAVLLVRQADDYEIHPLGALLPLAFGPATLEQ